MANDASSGGENGKKFQVGGTGWVSRGQVKRYANSDESLQGVRDEDANSPRLSNHPQDVCCSDVTTTMFADIQTIQLPREVSKRERAKQIPNEENDRR